MSSYDPDLLPPPLAKERRGWRTADVARATVVVLAVWFGLQLFWSVSSLVFLVFLATLFGLATARGVDRLERFRIRRGVGSALIVFGALGTIGGVLALTAPTLVEQGSELQREFPASLAKLQAWVDSKGTGMLGTLLRPATTPAAPPTAPGASPAPAGAAQAAQPLPAQPSRRTGAQAPAPTKSQPSSATTALKERLTAGLGSASRYLFSFVTSTVSVIASFVLLVFLAVYIGAEPEVYHGWILSVVPATSRAHVRIVLARVATVLRKWLVTQMIAMLAIGSVTTVILLIMGVKAPFALGFIAGLMEFIPTVGPIFSAVPAILMGFVDSPEKALAVVVAYWGIQFIENNLLIPFLMRGEMDLPPAITLVAQALMTLTFGFIGLMVAVPVTAAVLVPLRMMAERENAREHAMRRAARAPAPDPDDDSDASALEAGA